MQFLLLIYDQEKRWTKLSDTQQNSETQEYGAFGKEFAKAIRGGNALQPTPTAKTVRVRNGKDQITDGPFAETKEHLAGYYIMNCENLDEAIEWAARMPTACQGAEGCIEIRPMRWQTSGSKPGVIAENTVSANG